MADYVLHPDEAVILKENTVYYGPRALNAGTFELVLTSKKLVLIRKHLGLRASVTPKEVRTFPISQIKLFNGQPQVMLVNRKEVEIYFLNGPETFRFSLNKVAANWVDQINLLASGRESEVVVNNNVTNASSPDYIKDINREAWDILWFRPGAKPRAPEIVQKVSGECSHCGAPIEGLKDRVATCAYCGKSQQVNQPMPPAPAPAPVNAPAPAPAPAPGQVPAAAPTPGPPAGWNPDPKRSHHYRWWDGRTWTSHVSDYGHVSSDPL